MRSWWLDERGHAGTEHLDPAYVRGYDRKSGYDPSDDVQALRAQGLDAGAVVVDIGAGTGAFTLAVAPLCRHVFAVDVSPAMTAALRRRLSDVGLENVTVVDAGFLSYEHRGEPADFVFTRNALHHLPDFWKVLALQRVTAMLRSGGVLRLHDLVFDFSPNEADGRIEAWLSGAVDDPSIGYTAAELAEHVRIEYSTYSWLLDVILDRTGFDVVERSFRRAAYGTYTCTRRAEGAAR